MARTRAEAGMTGDNDFHMKVSADGSVWREALLIDGASGRVSSPQTSFAAGDRDGDIQFTVESALAADPHFHFDADSGRLGVGTDTPLAVVHAAGDDNDDLFRFDRQSGTSVWRGVFDGTI